MAGKDKRKVFIQGVFLTPVKPEPMRHCQDDGGQNDDLATLSVILSSIILTPFLAIPRKASSVTA